MIALATLILGFITGIILAKNPISIKISVDKRDIPAETVAVIPEPDFKAIQEQQYDEFMKADKNRKDVNTAVEEDKEDIATIFRIFNGGK